MSRTVRDTSLETKAARLQLAPRRKPYWRVLESGLHIGYRRIKAGGGSWIARRFTAERKYLETKIGTADDLTDADGASVFTFSKAQEAARVWWKSAQRVDQGLAPDAGPYTVADALRDYFEARELEGSKDAPGDRKTAKARIVPQLGSMALEKLTTAKIRSWLSTLAKSDVMFRAKLSGERITRAVDADDPEAVRARRSTANRILTILKAALNHAFNHDRAASDLAWRKVKPFEEADAARVRYLTIAEAKRLINASPPDFRLLVRAALATGARYGELARMEAADFNRDAGTISVRQSKAAKPRHIVLNDEGRGLFEELSAGRGSRELILKRGDGEPWGKSHQQRPVKAASLRAKIEPEADFHCLRHTYASHAIMNGAPLMVVAKNLGHTDTRMVEKHYGHLSASYIADAIRAAAPNFGGGEKSNVVAIGS